MKVYVLTVCLEHEPGDEVIGVYATKEAVTKAQNETARNDYVLRGRLKGDGVSLLIQEFEVQN